MKGIFTRLLNNEIECTSSHARPWLVTYASVFDICDADSAYVVLGDSPFKMDECLKALFGNVGYVVAFDHGQGVRLYSKDGEPLPSVAEALSGTFDKHSWQLIEKQPITKTIMDQIQGLEGEVLADKLREIAQAVENNAIVNVNKRRLLEPESIVTFRGHIAIVADVKSHISEPFYVLRLVNGIELFASVHNVEFVRPATQPECNFFNYMHCCYDMDMNQSTCKGPDFTELVSECAPDIQRQATYWYSSGRSIALDNGFPEQYEETSTDIMHVKADKKTPKQETLRARTVCKHIPTGRLCCVSHEDSSKSSIGYWCIFVDGSRARVRVNDLQRHQTQKDYAYFKCVDSSDLDTGFSPLDKHPVNVHLFGAAMYSGISEEMQRQAVACKLAGMPIVTDEREITIMRYEPKRVEQEATPHVFRVGDRVCVRTTGVPAVVFDVSRLITIVDIFGAEVSVLPQKLVYVSRCLNSEILLFEELKKGNFFFTPELQKKFAKVNTNLLDWLKKLYDTGAELNRRLSEAEDEDDEC